MDPEPTLDQHRDPAVEQPADQADQATGHDTVDAAMDRLAALDQLPLERHAEVFDEVHRALAAVLDAPLEAHRART